MYFCYEGGVVWTGVKEVLKEWAVSVIFVLVFWSYLLVLYR